MWCGCLQTLAFLGAIGIGDLVWTISDIGNALMAIPNLIAILLLSPVLFKLVKEDESKDSIFKH